MLVITVVLALASVALAAPQSGPSKDAVILRYENDNSGIGQYRYAFETSDGIAQEEQGQLVNAGTDNEYNTVQGKYSFTGPDGVLYTVIYTADQDGFHPQGAHIPTR